MTYRGTVLRIAPPNRTIPRPARRNPIDRVARSSLRSVLRAMPVLLVALVLLIAAFPAAADEDVEFDGAGWGHGVGMSQWGAYAQAKGWKTSPRSYTQILSHYYAGTSIASYDAVSPGHGDLWVNLEGDKTNLLLVVRKIGINEQVPAHVARGEEAVDLTKDQSLLITWIGDDTCTVDFRNSSNLADTPFTTWAAGSCEIDITWDGDTEGTPTTLLEIYGCTLKNWDTGQSPPCRYARGSLHTYDNGARDGDDGYDLVLQIDIDDYTLGISEVSYSWPKETLKAQAVASRSYAAEALDRLNPLTRACACHVLDTAGSQRYVGWGHGTSNWILNVDATENQVLTYGSKVISAVYGSSNGGASEAAHEKWGGSVRPYLVSVDDPFSLHPDNPYSSWKYTIPAASLAAKVWGAGAPTLTSVQVTATNTSGSAKTVEFYAASDDRTTLKSGAWVADVLGLRSWYFDVDYHFGPSPPPELGFTDVEGNVHEANIEYLADRGIALSCDDGPDRYCPDDPMRREDIAAFIARALELPAAGKDYFVDDNGLPFESDINRIAAAGITKGCNPPANDHFCPDSTVTRGQMAAFLVRAWKLTDPGKGNWFIDDDRSVFEADIDKLAAAGITKGCNPPSNNRYCPLNKVTRAHTASFLARALQTLGS
jgi:SpoIID/LytB domain protein